MFNPMDKPIPLLGIILPKFSALIKNYIGNSLDNYTPDLYPKSNTEIANL